MTVRWYGNLLTWNRVPSSEHGWLGCWTTTFAGRTHRIVKLARQGVHPGWHLYRHPDSDPDDPRVEFGPSLAHKLAGAKLIAEVWILTPPRDRQPGDGSPSLLTVMGGGGAAFGTPLWAAARAAGDWSSHGASLVAYPDHEHRRITVHRPPAHDAPSWPDRGEMVATITPQFDDLRSITWDASLVGAEPSVAGPAPSWRAAVLAVGAEFDIQMAGA